MNKENNKGTMKDTPKKTVKKTSKDKKIEITKFGDLEGKFLLVKVGNSEMPATDQSIKDIKEQIVGLFEKNDINCLVLVTHHAVSMNIIERVTNINGV